jgi:hypothetical protein
MPNEGEGSKSADLEYRRAATRFAKSGKVERKAHEAEEALDDPSEREDLERAEDKVRHRKE